MDTDTKKLCKGCNKSLENDEFIQNNKTYKTCNKCREKDNKIKAKNYEKNKEKILERNSKYYSDNKDKICEQKKEYQTNRIYQNIRCLKCNKDLTEDNFDIKNDGSRYAACKECIIKDRDNHKKK